ncbi:Ig-like domain-containing protein [Actinoallomurus purpureus]|uniref:L,D-transpeptidase n=1 Tax=Actinoallomurus purpureus TaxID=478114 RepID=UPI0020930AAF|nr:Ig-like domain-containing protein [Actinoallomurus purpureus]MCO6004397.1 Ig-like domain-containing protein [Actinoallomurus purpureus]
MRNRRLFAGLALAAATVATMTACSGGGQKATSVSADATVRITPADATRTARPDQGVAVAVSGGRLEEVDVRQDGTTAPGVFGADHTSWKTTWTLKPGAWYQVKVTTRNSRGRLSAVTSRFRTAPAGRRIAIADVTPQAGENVGVGMPIMVTFDGPVADRDQVQHALEVRAGKADEGAWHWMSDRQVVYRTHRYWQPHQKVVFTAHLAGVRAAKGVYGTADVTKAFSIGASNVTVASSKTHYMKVDHDGVMKTFKISMGKATTREYTTTSGIHLTKEKAQVVPMESPNCGPNQPGCDYYKEDVHLAVRISDGGEYVHQSVGEYDALGVRNASHGCVRTSPAGARYFFGIAQRGDIVKVTGTTRRFVDETNAGDWKFWNYSWDAWLKNGDLQR